MIDFECGIPEAAFFQHFASSTVAAGITVASVDGGFTQPTMISWCAKTLVIALASRPTGGAILTGKGVTSVTLGQHFVGYFT